MLIDHGCADYRREAGVARARYIAALFDNGWSAVSGLCRSAGARLTMGRIQMHSINGATRFIGRERVASTAARREADGTLKAAMNGGAGLVALVLLFLASAAYVVFGGAFATETASAPEAPGPVATAAVTPEVAQRAPRREQAASDSSGSVPPASLVFLDRGDDGDGNVMTYEHD